MEFDAETIEIKDYRDDDGLTIRVMKLRLPPGLDFQYAAGQFVMLAMDGFALHSNPDALKWTSYSLASEPSQKGGLEFCIKLKETNGFTHFLKDHQQLGSKIKVKGPFGNFNCNHPAKKILFIAAGTGISPIMSLMRSLLHNGAAPEIFLMYGFRNTNLFVYREELDQYSKTHHNITFIPTQSRPDTKWQGRKGYVQESAKELKIEAPHEACAFICGNPLMVEENKKILLEKGLPAANIHIEQWEGA
ncbi:MAG: FAD-binding oxidoreductase [Candidatus Micrarchaeota archaeon]